MNKLLVLTVLISFSHLAIANCDKSDSEADKKDCLAKAEAIRSQPGGNNSNNNGANNFPYNDCQQIYDSVKPVPLPIAAAVDNAAAIGASAVVPILYFTPNTPKGVPTNATPASSEKALPPASIDSVVKCRALENISIALGAQSLRDTDIKTSQDKKITCVKRSGITADWQSCTSAVSMYDTILVAEAAMQVFQGVQTNKVQTQAQNDFDQRSRAGDGQNAAFDAQTASVNSAKALNEQQAAAYAAAVAALYSKIQSWIKETPEAFSQKGCGATVAVKAPADPQLKLYQDKDSVPRPSGTACVPHAQQALSDHRAFVFANSQAKGQLTTQAMMFAAKAIAAGIKASQLGNIAKRVEEAKQQTENEFDAPTFERCQVDPTNPACAGPVTRTNGSGLQEGGFGFGDSFGNNAFTPIGEEEKLGDIAPLPLPGEDSVAGVSNPFVDDAKAASGILDPAGAASVQPGAAGGGGGGGGASAPGGGSASLGNDTPGADDSKKENDIKANKADGKYNLAGGGAFQAIKPLSNENPFANLFDGKSGGKLEEDRSIASGDIDGQDSGLFSKISKRYGQVQADKRIEAKNLEE